ncbi:MAG: hypothetical protein QM536_03835 [Chitinophagaceae bacterium]|nr:hypothetical protein [Chitinophagaceae bacterium]
MQIYNLFLKRKIVVAFVICCIIFFLLWGFQYTTLFLAEHLIKQTVERESKGLYFLRFEKISFHIWDETIHLKNATFSPQDSLSTHDSTTTYHIQTKSFNIQLKDIWKIYVEKDLSIQKIILDNPSILCKKNTNSTKDNNGHKHISKELENFYANIRKYLVHFQIKSFSIKDGNIDYVFHTPQKKIVFEFHGIHFRVTNFELWRDNPSENTHSFYTDNIILEIKNQKIYFENKGYVASFDNLFIDTQKKYAEFKKLKIVKIEQVPDDKNKNICNIHLAHLTLNGVDFLKISHDTLQVESIILQKPIVDIVQNSTKNHSKNFHIETLIPSFFTSLLKSNIINNLHFQKGIIHIRTPSGENFSLQNTSFSLFQIQLDSATLLDSKKQLVQKLTFTIEKYTHILSDKNHQVSVENISFTGSDSSFSAQNIQITPQFSPNSKNIRIEKIHIKKIDWKTLLETKKKRIKEITVENVFIHIILKDKKTFSTHLNIKSDSIPIYTLPFFQNLFIEKIEIKNAQININHSKNIPILSIENLNINISQFPFPRTFSLKKIVESKDYNISTDNIIYNIDHENTLTLAGISLSATSSNQNILKAKKMHFLSQKNNSSFFTDYAEITNIFSSKYSQKEHIHAQKISIENPNLQLFVSNMKTETQHSFLHNDFHTDTMEIKNGTLSFQTDSLSLFLSGTHIFIANPPIQNTTHSQENNWKTIQNATIDIRNYTFKKQNTFAIQGEYITAALHNDTAALQSTAIALHTHTTLHSTDTLFLENIDINGILWKKITNGTLECNAITNTNGKLSLHIFPTMQKHSPDTSHIKKILKKTLSHSLKHIKIHSLKPHFSSIHIQKEDTSFTMKNLFLHISAFEIDKHTMEKQNTLFAFQDIALHSGKNRIEYPYFLFQNDSSLFSTQQKLLILKRNTLSLKTTLLLQNDSIICKDIDAHTLFHNGSIIIKNIAIYSNNVLIQTPNSTHPHPSLPNITIKEFLWHSKKTHLAIESPILKHISSEKSKISFRNITLNPFSYEAYQIIIENGNIYPKDALQTIYFHSLNTLYNKDTALFIIEKLHYKSDNTATNIYNVFQKNHTTASADKITILHTDILKSIITQKLTSPFIEIQNPKITLFKNRKLSAEHKKHPFYEIQVQKSPIPLDIQTMKIHNGLLSYHEISKKGHQSGEIFLANMDATIKDIHKHGTISGDAHFKVMGAGNIHTTFQFQQKATNPIHTIEGNLGSFDLKLLNHFLENVGFTSVKTGKVDTMLFSMKLEPNESTGTVVFLYKDLKIKILHNEEYHKRKIGSNISTFFANTFIVSNQNPHPTFTKIGNISFERDSTKSIFNYLAKSFLSGIISSIGIKNVENKLKEKTIRKNK